ncbi:hypothetical protein [Allosphingosinicella vermicomposti]|uniref:hypothetical protein n=1 Tax=Allosphingosinicella vermicomposti TaxID=614671 RepID=UPI000D0EAD8C|nr:hypothetical protein [Allosphingosinicella vermicomposti]
MTGEEFDDFAALWRDEPSPEEQAALEALARRTSRRARLMQQLEIGGGVIVMLALAAGLILTPAPAVLFTVTLLIVVLIWSSWRRYTLTKIALLVDTSDRSTLLDNAIRSADLRLRRSRFGLWLIVPGYVLGIMTLHAMEKRNLDDILNVLLLHASPLTRPGIATIFVLGGLFAFFLKAHRDIQRELDHLRERQEQYLREARLDELAEPQS